MGRSRGNRYEVLPGSHAAILPASLTEPVAARMATRARGWKVRDPLIHPLTGLLYCSGCDERLLGTTKRDCRIYRHVVHTDCPLPFSYEAAELEALVRTHVAELKIPRAYREQADETISRVLAAEVGGVKNDRRRMEQSLERLKELYLEGEIEQDEYRRRRAEYQNALAKAPVSSSLPASSVMAVNASAAAMTATPAALRDLARSLYTRIEIGPDCTLTYMPREWCESWA